MRRKPLRWLFALLLACLLGAAWMAYASGFGGGFLFDDYANLPAIGASGPVDDWPTFWRYITSGDADPTGRPLALLSFLLDARNWPADPRPFLTTNLILHLLNGLLLALLLRALGRAALPPVPPNAAADRTRNLDTGSRPSAVVPAPTLRALRPAYKSTTDRHPNHRHSGAAEPSYSRHSGATEGRTRNLDTGAVDPPPHPEHAEPSPLSRPAAACWRIDLAAVFGAGLWLLHPLMVSTTLYIVQREAMLPATFLLLGLLAWLHGRRRMLAGKSVSGLAWLALGLGGCTLLGVLSKANGILLPALALVIEYFWLRTTLPSFRVRQGTQEPRHSGRGEDAIRNLDTTSSRPDGTPSAAGEDSGFRLRRPRNDEELGQRPRNDEVWGQLHPNNEEPGRRASSNHPSFRSARSADAESLHNCAKRRGARSYRQAMWLLAWLPAALVALYLLYAGYNGIVHGVAAHRPWTLVERLLTQPRVLLDYLSLLWLPRPFTPGLFNDQIVASTSLLAPWTTLPSLLAVLGLIAGAWLLRHRWPALSLAVLFYFVGQSLESSTIALELYFEHRNYLPALLMFWPLALWLCGLTMHAKPRKQASSSSNGRQGWAWLSPGKNPMPPRVVGNAKLLFGIVLLAGLALMTHARAGLWGNQHDQALLWAKLNPASPRAQAYAAMKQMAAGHPRLAAARLAPWLRKQPEEVQLALNLLGAECQLGRVRPETLAASKRALRTTRNSGTLLTHWFSRAIASTTQPPCPQLTLDTLEQLLDAAAANPKLMAIAGRRQDNAYLQGLIALARGNGEVALVDFNRSLDQDPRVSAALAYAARLGSAGFPKLGLAHLDHYARVAEQQAEPAFDMARLHAWVLKRQGYWEHELQRLRRLLREDAADSK